MNTPEEAIEDRMEAIKKELGFVISRRVPDGIREVNDVIKNKMIINPDNSQYKNS